jgi:hypothetical protein
MLLLAQKLRRGELERKRRAKNTPERLQEIEAAARKFAEERGREFYYVHQRCSNGHFSRRSVLTGECLKCRK